MEATRMLIAFASHMEFTLFQIDMKSAFLNGFLKKEVYIKLPPYFERHVHPEHESHLKVAKRILGYLKGMQDLVLYYPSGDNIELVGYANADYVEYLVYTFGSLRTKISKSDIALLGVFAQNFQKPSRNLVPVTQ
uniref:Uncharacterized protein LOC104212696 n=1 Tax=Nicotiana sylvestris TaxID=4096 RepID=A0A1U7VET6_NICSY